MQQEGEQSQVRRTKWVRCEWDLADAMLRFQDEENGVLGSKLKEAVEDRARLQRTTSMQQTQLEKHQALAEGANRNCDGLRHQVTALQKARLDFV